MPFNAINTQSEFDTFYDSVVRYDRTRFWFAIVLKKACSVTRKTRNAEGVEMGEEVTHYEEETMAGVTGLLNVDVGNSSAEIGFVSFSSVFLLCPLSPLFLYLLTNNLTLKSTSPL